MTPGSVFSIPFLLFFSLIFLISSIIFVTIGRGERGSEQHSQSFSGMSRFEKIRSSEIVTFVYYLLNKTK